MVVSLLAVLKTGAAYVAVAPDYPRDRIAFMLTNAGAAAVVTTSSLTVDLPADVPIVRLDLEVLTLASFDAARPDLVTDGEAPAYVLYTSGSTGQPKGVVIPHRALVNHMRWFLEAFGLSADDRVLQKTPFSFDASVWEFYAPLLCGGTLVVAEPDGHRDPAYLCRVIRETGVTTLQVVPSLLALLLEEPHFAACTTLTRIFCGGEALPPSLRDGFFAKSQARLVNLYGPTEVTIDSVAWECRPGESSAVVPIGRPIRQRAGVRAGCRIRAGAGRAARRTVPRRCGRRPRLPWTARSDGRRLRSRCLRRRPGRPAVPDRRSRTLPCRRSPRVPRPAGRPGEAPRLPHRAR